MAPLVDVAVPADQAEGTEMVVGTWFKQVGEAVTENEPLLEINTDKVTVEVAAPATGVLYAPGKALTPDGRLVAAGLQTGRGIRTGSRAMPACRCGASHPPV